MLLRGIAGLFDDNPQFQVVGTALTCEDAVALVQTEAPDVVTFDLSMPGEVFSTIATLVADFPGLRIIIFTAYDNIDMAVRAIDAGAHAFVLKGRPSDDLFDAMAAVQAGGSFASPGFAERLTAALRDRPAPARGADMSPRELQIIEYLLQGKSNKEIARALGLREKTIKHYMTNLMTKLKVRSRLEVVLAVQTMSPGEGPRRFPVQPEM